MPERDLQGSLSYTLPCPELGVSLTAQLFKGEERPGEERFGAMAPHFLFFYFFIHFFWQGLTVTAGRSWPDHGMKSL